LKFHHFILNFFSNNFRLFEYSEIKDQWIFAKDLTTQSEIRNNSQVVYHAISFLKVFNKAIGSLKPNVIPHLEDLVQLGSNHYSYGVHCHHYKVLSKNIFILNKNTFENLCNLKNFEECLILSIKERLQNDYNQNVDITLKKFYWFIARKICYGLFQSKFEKLSMN
jgi:hypothetical protein